MAAESGFSYLKRSFPAEGIQRLAPVHINPVFLPQVNITFRCIPGSVFLRGGGILFFVRRGLEAVHDRVRAYPVGAVTVFSLQVMGQQHIRLELPDPAGHGFIHPVFIPVFILLLQREGEGIFKVSPNGIVLHTAGPQAVQELQPPVGHGGHHHTDLADLAFFAGIPGQGAAEPQHFVVRMGHQQHQVRFFGAGLPLLRLRRNISLSVDPQLRHVEMALLPGSVRHPEHGGSFRQGKVFRQVAAVCMAGVCPGTAFVLYLHAPGMGMLIPLHHHAGSALACGYGDLNITLVSVVGSPVGFIIPVLAFRKGFAAGAGVEFAVSGDVRRGFRPRGGTAKKSRDYHHRGNEYPAPDLSVIFQCSSSYLMQNSE